MAIAGTSRTTAIHGSSSCVRPRATSSVTRPQQQWPSGGLGGGPEAPARRERGPWRAVRRRGPSRRRGAGMRRSAPPHRPRSSCRRSIGSGPKETASPSCHRSSPRWPMAVVASIPAASAPTNAPTNEMVGATIGWSLRRVRAMATHIPKPSTISTPTTMRNCLGCHGTIGSAGDAEVTRHPLR